MSKKNDKMSIKHGKCSQKNDKMSRKHGKCPKKTIKCPENMVNVQKKR